MASAVVQKMNNSIDDEEQRLRDRLKQRQQARRSASYHEDPDMESKPNGAREGKRARREDHRVRDKRAGSRDDSRYRYPGPSLQYRGVAPPPHAYQDGPPNRGWNGPRRGFRGPPQPRVRGPLPPPLPPPTYYRGGPPPRDRGVSRSRSLSTSRSRSYSMSRSRSRSRSRSPYSSDASRSSYSSYDSKSLSGSSSSDESDLEQDETTNALTKDQRTVFVSQLVMRAEERDIKKYFRKKLGARVNEVVLLRDKRSGRHKGCAYVELGRIEDVQKVLAASNQPPDFQRFPILVKASEAEKNYTLSQSQATVTAKQVSDLTLGPLLENGRVVEAQKVYLGNLDVSVSEKTLYSIFSSFGHLLKVALQMDPTTGTSRGFAFLSYRDPKDANLAIHTMSGQIIAGRQIKTGWANQTSTVPGVDVVTSTEFPPDAASRIQNAHLALSQVTGATGIVRQAQVSAPLVSQIARPAPTPVVDDAKIVKNADNPTSIVLVHNMFDKDKETDPGWEEDIRLDFEEECSKWGKILSVVVMHKEAGGKIYASFETTDQAKICASNLAGRWFDKRQLRVEFVKKMPSKEK